MPTYEFRCPSGHDFENFYRSIGAAPSEVLCPTCGKVASRQLSAGGGLLFKGSGFYITDYGKDGKKSQAAAPPAREKAESASGNESPTSKADSPSGADKSSSSDSGSATSPAKPAVESKPASAAKKPKPSE